MCVEAEIQEPAAVTSCIGPNKESMPSCCHISCYMSMRRFDQMLCRDETGIRKASIHPVMYCC